MKLYFKDSANTMVYLTDGNKGTFYEKDAASEPNFNQWADIKDERQVSDQGTDNLYNCEIINIKKFSLDTSLIIFFFFFRFCGLAVQYC